LKKIAKIGIAIIMLLIIILPSCFAADNSEEINYYISEVENYQINENSNGTAEYNFLVGLVRVLCRFA